MRLPKTPKREGFLDLESFQGESRWICTDLGAMLANATAASLTNRLADRLTPAAVERVASVSAGPHAYCAPSLRVWQPPG